MPSSIILKTVFRLTEFIRDSADLIAFILLAILFTAVCSYLFDLNTPALGLAFIFALLTPPILLGLSGRSRRFHMFLSTLFLQQVSEEDIQDRINRLNTLVMGWYEKSGYPSDRVVTVMPLVSLKGRKLNLDIRVTMSYSNGNKTLPEFEQDKVLQRALKNIISPQGTSIYQLSSLDCTRDNGPIWMMLTDDYLRRTIPREMSNHERIAALESYNDFVKGLDRSVGA